MTDLDASDKIIVTPHAGQRIRDRLGNPRIADVLAEIRASILLDRVAARRDVFDVYSADRRRRYVLEPNPPGRMMLLTVVTPTTSERGEAVERSGPPLRRGFVST